MRILIVRNAFSYDFGGAEKLAVFLGRELIENSHTTRIVTAHKSVANLSLQLNVPVIRGWWWSKQDWSGKSALLTPFYFCWLIILFVKYCSIIIRFRPDILHLMSKDDFIAATAAGRLFRKKVLWTDCADLKFLYKNIHAPFKNPIGKMIYAMSCHASTVTLVSQNEKRLIEHELGETVPGNYRVIYMVGRDEQATPLPRNKKEIIFCATSRLVLAKGIGELIEAFSLAANTHPNYRLWIVGDGPDAEKFKQKANDSSVITFFGHQDDPLKYLAAADVYVHPTYHEGFSLSLAEAAMLGKPMIATNVGGNPELVTQDNGILVPIKDVMTLKNALVELGEDASRRESMGKRARKDFLSKYNFSRVVKEEILPLYEK